LSKEALTMKKLISLLGVLAMVTGCAVGSEDPNGDTNLSTEQGGTVAADPNSADLGGDPTTTQNTGNQATVLREHRSSLDLAPQVIPSRPHRGSGTPDPGPVHGPGPGGPVQE
jgi:hypothetical protein